MFLCSAAELHEKPGCHRGTECPSEAAFFVARTRLAGAKAATSSLILIPAGENFIEAKGVSCEREGYSQVV
jgi:hypothetical protein